jgi:hypothetical protein
MLGNNSRQLLTAIMLLCALRQDVCSQVQQTLPEQQPRGPFRQATLPTDRSLRVDAALPLNVAPEWMPDSSMGGHSPPESCGQLESDTSSGQSAGPPRKLFSPRFDFSAEWEPRTNGFGISSFDSSISQGIMPIFGPPPPVFNAGYSLTLLESPELFELPDELQEFSFGASWMRRVNERWMMRFMLSGAFASDLQNTGSDAWQIRGGIFALYRPAENWSWAFGAMATGRDDLPVLPAIGAIWQPADNFKVNLMMPSPRLSWLLLEAADKQHWGYVGAGITGGTWAVQRGGVNDRLTYREWRFVLGWEVVPPQPPGTFMPTGTTWNSEVGIAVGRRFEFDRDDLEIDLDSTLLLRTGVRF